MALSKVRDLINDNQRCGEVPSPFASYGAVGNVAVFGKLNDSAYCTELLKYIINKDKNITISTDDVKSFNNTIKI